MMSIYLATSFLDGPLLAARAAAEPPAVGLSVVKGGDWWSFEAWITAEDALFREEEAILNAKAIVVLLTDRCGVGTGYEVAFAHHRGTPIFWIDCGRTKEISLCLAVYGRRVESLAEVAQILGVP